MSLSNIRRFLIIAFVCVCVVDGFVQSTVKPPPKPFRRDYIYMEEFREFVKINTKKKTWHQAKAYCEAEGASLGVIVTSAEAMALIKILETFPKNSQAIWIGLQDIISEGEFQTIDGVPISSVYGEWADGEPNDTDGHEDCVTLSINGKLNDDTCTKQFSFLCKKDANSVTPNTACDNFDLDYKLVLQDRQCIKFHQTPKTWDEAYVICTAEQAHLAIINSQEEADLYVREFAKYPEGSLNGNFEKRCLLLGFHDKFTEGDFVTVDNHKLSETGYEVWSNGQPDNTNNVENCGSMFRDGKLNDIDCNSRAMFICEKNFADPNDVSFNSRMDHN